MRHFTAGELTDWFMPLIVITVTTMASMARTQPWQNVIVSMVWMLLLSAAFFLLFPNVVPALPRSAAPLLWSNAVLNSRGIGKLMLRRWRSNEFYGYWLIGIAGILSTVVLLPWKPNAAALGTGFAVAGVLQILSIPWLIEKKPGLPAPNWWPLTVWIFLVTASFVYARWHATQ